MLELLKNLGRRCPGGTSCANAIVRLAAFRRESRGQYDKPASLSVCARKSQSQQADARHGRARITPGLPPSPRLASPRTLRP